MADEWVKIIHPETLGVAEVNRSALPHHYAAGWRLLADDEAAQDEPEPDPEPMTRAQAAKVQGKAAPAAKEK